MSKKVRWIVSLSNGETLYEERGNFKIIKDAPSPWQRLLSHAKVVGAEITSMSLIHGDTGRHYHLPSAGINPKFAEFGAAPKPVSYNFFRKMGSDINKTTGEPHGKRDLFTVIEAIYHDDVKLQLWVDESNGNCWTMIV